MEESKGYISKKKTGEGFHQEVFAEGIEILQKLSGNKWTDYNHHDPGVTMLEAISFALSEIDYKTESKIEDLLLKDAEHKLQSGDNGLFICSDIMTTNPVTITDMRKLILDRVPSVKNVWITTLTTDHNFKGIDFQISTFSGLYSIQVEMEYISAATFEDKKAEVMKVIRRVFYEHRNICEYLYDIQVYSPYQLAFHFDISIDETAHGEYVLAEVINAINDYLSKDVEFKSLWEVENHYPTEEIYNGPKLKNGFILDSSLLERKKEVNILEIINLVGGINGVVSVNALKPYHKPNADQLEFELFEGETLEIPEGYFPILKIPEENKDVVFRSAGLRYHADMNEVRNELAYVDSVKYGNLKSGSKTSNEIEIPHGKYLDIKSYYPLKYHLPDHYGVGHNGLVSGLEPIRYAQARQLKAYLMPIDQIMANMLGLIAHLNQIYDVSEHHVESYFSEVIEDTDQNLDLLDLKPSRKKRDQLNEWEFKLKSLDKKHDTQSIDRLRRVTDDLLSRFSESYPDYALTKTYSQTLQHLSEDQISAKILRAKRNYLNNYDAIGYERTKSCNYFQLSELLNNNVDHNQIEAVFPGVIRKLAALMDIDDYAIRSLVACIEDSDLSIYSETSEVKEVLKNLSKDEEELSMNIEEYPSIEEADIFIDKSFYFYGTPNDLIRDVLKYGIQQSNYRIKHIDKEGERMSHVWLNMGKKEVLVHANRKPVKAEKYLNNTILELRKINEESEGLFFIEHVALMPKLYEKNFGFLIGFKKLNPGIDIKITHTERQTIGDRHELIERLISSVFNGTINFQINNTAGQYFLEVTDKTGIIAVSDKKFTDSELDYLCEQMELILQEIHKASFSTVKSWMDSFQKIVYFENNKVDEQFFASKLSFVFPSWPVRFQDKNFRELMDNTIRDILPIHLINENHWIDFDDLKTFENLYFDWMRSFDAGAENDRQSKAYALVSFLQNLENQDVD